MKHKTPHIGSTLSFHLHIEQRSFSQMGLYVLHIDLFALERFFDDSVFSIADISNSIDRHFPPESVLRD